MQGCAPVRLRRDGARPLAFRGLAIAGRTATGALAGFTQRLGLWLVEDGSVAVEMALTGPAGGWPRSRHLAARVASAADLAAVLDAIDPAAGPPDPALWAGPPPGEAAARADPALAAAIRAEFRAPAASLCAVLPAPGGRTPLPEQG